MDLLTSIRERLNEVDDKLANDIRDYAIEEDISFKASAEHAMGRGQSAEKAADKAFDSWIDQKSQEYDEVDAKGIRNTIRSLIKNPETFDEKEQLLGEIDRLEAERELDDATADRARRFAKKGDFTRALRAMRDKSTLVDRIVDRVGRKANVDLKGDDEDEDVTEKQNDNMPEDNEDGDNSSPMDILDDDVKDNIESLANELDEDPEMVAERVGVMPNSGGDDGGMKQAARGVSDSPDTDNPEDEEMDGGDGMEGVESEELNQKLESMVEDAIDSKSDELAEAVGKAIVENEEIAAGLVQKATESEEGVEALTEAVDKKASEGGFHTPTPQSGSVDDENDIGSMFEL